MIGVDLGGSAILLRARIAELAPRVIDAARAQGVSLAAAESLTAGLVCARLADVPGASDVLRGGVVSYAVEVKEAVLGVDPELLAERGAVDAEVAQQMAAGAARVCGALLAVATTGVAGPGPSDGHPAGEVFVGVRLADGTTASHRLELGGDRTGVREGATLAALGALAEALGVSAASNSVVC